MPLSRQDTLKMIEDAAKSGVVPVAAAAELPPVKPAHVMLEELLPGIKAPAGALACVASLSHEDRAFAARLAGEYGQAHILEAWPAAGTEDDQKRSCLAQCRQLDASYPGGIAAYVASARKLLGQSQRGENPLDGWTPSVPADGFDLAPGSAEYEKYEEAGLAEAGKLGFVVPAGGLGERLGYHGVKFALPSETSSGATVLRVCARRPPNPSQLCSLTSLPLT